MEWEVVESFNNISFQLSPSLICDVGLYGLCPHHPLLFTPCHILPDMNTYFLYSSLTPCFPFCYSSFSIFFLSLLSLLSPSSHNNINYTFPTATVPYYHLPSPPPHHIIILITPSLLLLSDIIIFPSLTLTPTAADMEPPFPATLTLIPDSTQCVEVLLVAGDGYERTETFSLLLTTTTSDGANVDIVRNVTEITILDSDSESVCLSV